MTIAINGSPRKNWNTHILLTKALEGAASKGAKTELVNLYDLNYKGCISCYACKRKDGKSIGRCAVKDDLAAVFEKVHKCDGLILGSPIYFSEVTGMMRAFMERLLFQYLSYAKDQPPQFGRQIPTAFIYTMNAPEAFMKQLGVDNKFKENASLLEKILGPSSMLISTETYQIDDYDRYNITMFDEAERKQRRKEVFPEDCRKAFELGMEMVK